MGNKVEFELELSEEAGMKLYMMANEAGISVDECVENILWKYVNDELTSNDEKEKTEDNKKKTGTTSENGDNSPNEDCR